MSKTKDMKMLTHGEVQKKIIENPPKIRPKEDLTGLFNRFRDENFDIYNEKRQQFLDACKKYNILNQETLICNRRRLLEDYRAILNCEFLEDAEDDKNDRETKGCLLRKRTERPIHQVTKQYENPCTMEPWLGRHLKLNKFIWAARKIILKNRMLRVLEKLKTVTEENLENFEISKKTLPNVSYAEIFAKFM